MPIPVGGGGSGGGGSGGGLLQSQMQMAGGGAISTSSFSYNSLFQQLGQIGAIINSTNAYRGVTLPSQTNVLALDYDLSGNQPVIDNLYTNLAGAQVCPGAYLGYLKQVAQNTVISEVNNVFPLANQTLTTAMQALILAMQQSGQTVSPNTITATAVATPTNISNGRLAITKRLATGRVAENSFPETLLGVVTTDGQPQGGATAGSETLQITGQAAVGDLLSWLYPGGSGTTKTLTAVNASLSNVGGSGNWLNNSDFTNWQNNVPSNWRVGVGIPGTTIVEGSSTFDSGNVLNFVGNGKELTSVYQILGTDTTTKVSPLQILTANIWISLSTIPASGSLEIALVDQAGNISTNSIGAQNAFVIDLTPGIAPWGAVPWGVGAWGLNEGWGAWGVAPWGQNPWGAYTGSPFSAFSESFQTPPSLASGNYALRIRLKTPLSAGCTLSIDGVAMTNPTSLYSQGPSVCWFGGPINAIKGDSYQLIIQNNMNGKIQTLFQQLFSMMTLGFLLPSGTNASQPNSWISG